MDRIVIEGGRVLSGRVPVSGAKNATLPLMAAALMARGETRLERVPRLRDIATMARMLERLGAGVQHEGDGLRIDASQVEDIEAPYELVRQMRASVYVLGPLLGRFGRARVSLPGGCAIGQRPIDLHLRGFEALGARIAIEHGYVEARAPEGGLRGADFSIAGPAGSSVGATCNVLMAAATARGRSVLRGAAREPHVQDLARFLVEMGARIEGIGSSVLEVEGVEGLEACCHPVIADQIEAGTYMVAGALCGGELLLEGCRPEDMAAEIEKLREMGGEVELSGEDRLRVGRVGPLCPTTLRTAPWPGFATDMQAQFMVALALAPGASTVTETIYPDRFLHAAELLRMGADIEVRQGTARIRGVERLSGATVMASDLRASAALVLAGLAAEGRSEILRVYHLDRGYERLEEKFAALGARIERVPAPPGQDA